jgi:hypothetical protein
MLTPAELEFACKGDGVFGELAREVVRLRAENEKMRKALSDARASWSFSDGQAHTHTWHDKAGWIERNKEALRAE